MPIYHYDALDRLAVRTDSVQDPTLHFYQANRLATKVSTARQRTVLTTDQQLLAQINRSAAGEHIDLIATDSRTAC